MKHGYDLEERTARFAENIIEFCKSREDNKITRPIINQLIRSGTSVGTSVGANYTEANNASPRNDFRNKIFISKKEAQETKYWLRMVAKSAPRSKEQSKTLWRECQELTMIFQKIVSTMRKK